MSALWTGSHADERARPRRHERRGRLGRRRGAPPRRGLRRRRRHAPPLGLPRGPAGAEREPTAAAARPRTSTTRAAPPTRSVSPLHLRPARALRGARSSRPSSTPTSRARPRARAPPATAGSSSASSSGSPTGSGRGTSRRGTTRGSSEESAAHSSCAAGATPPRIRATSSTRPRRRSSPVSSSPWERARRRRSVRRPSREACRGPRRGRARSCASWAQRPTPTPRSSRRGGGPGQARGHRRRGGARARDARRDSPLHDRTAKGLGVASGKPAYVTQIDAASGRVHLGDEESLLSRGDGGRHGPRARGRASSCVRVRIRYRHDGVPAELSSCEGSRPAVRTLTVRFDEPVRAVTPGQVAVFYDGDRVLGGGKIRGHARSASVAHLWQDGSSAPSGAAATAAGAVVLAASGRAGLLRRRRERLRTGDARRPRTAGPATSISARTSSRPTRTTTRSRSASRTGSDYASFSDGLSILVDNVHEIRGDAPYSPSPAGTAAERVAAGRGDDARRAGHSAAQPGPRSRHRLSAAVLSPPRTSRSTRSSPSRSTRRGIATRRPPAPTSSGAMHRTARGSSRCPTPRRTR